MARGNIPVTIRAPLNRPISAAENDQNLNNLRNAILLSSEAPTRGGNGLPYGRVADVAALADAPYFPNDYSPGEYTEIKNAGVLGLPAGVSDVILETFVAASGRAHQRAYCAVDAGSPPTIQEFIRLGSGVAWAAWQWVCTNSSDPKQYQFRTGQLCFTISLAAPDPGWVGFNDGTIGDAASGAGRASVDTQPLFNMLWLYSNANAPIFTSAGVASARGASALADWNSHKRMQLLKAAGRTLIAAGAGSGLTLRSPGIAGGEEAHTMTQAELFPHKHSTHFNRTQKANNASNFILSDPNVGENINGSVDLDTTTVGGTGGVTPLPSNIMQPFLNLNVWIKL